MAKIKIVKWNPLQKVFQLIDEHIQNSLDSRQTLVVFGWIGLVIFLSFSVLVGVNPLRVLVPFHVFSFPLTDSREEAIVYVSDGESRIEESHRKVYRPNPFQESIRELIEEVGRSPVYTLDEKSWEHWQTPIKKLPNLTPALKAIWIRKNGKELLLDFSQKAIDQELSKYSRVSSWIQVSDNEDEDLDTLSYYGSNLKESPNFQTENQEKKKQKILHLTWKAVELTIKANHPSVENVFFYLDGNLVNIQNEKN